MTTKSRSRNSSEYSANYGGQEENTDARNINYKKEKPARRAEDHLEKFQESLEKVDANVAADFRDEKSLLEYKPEGTPQAHGDLRRGLQRHRPQLVQGQEAGGHRHNQEHLQARLQRLRSPGGQQRRDGPGRPEEDIQERKQGITDFRFNEEAGNIEFDFKDLKQLERVADKAKRKVEILKTEEHGSSKNSSESSKESDQEGRTEQPPPGWPRRRTRA